MMSKSNDMIVSEFYAAISEETPAGNYISFCFIMQTAASLRCLHHLTLK